MKVRCIQADDCNAECYHHKAHEAMMMPSTLQPCSSEFHCSAWDINVYCYELETEKLGAAAPIKEELIPQPA